MSISTHHLTFSILEWNLNNCILKETVYSKVMTVAMMEIIIYIYIHHLLDKSGLLESVAV